MTRSITIFAPVFALFLSACPPTLVDWQDEELGPEEYPDLPDADGDGFTIEEGDCDDDDPWIGPHVSEVWYDGLDEDCDGGSDYDQDGDGHDASGYGGDDCNDLVVEIHGGAQEIGDGLDNDCDGELLSVILGGPITLDQVFTSDFNGTPYESESHCVGTVEFVLEEPELLVGDAELSCGGGPDESGIVLHFDGRFEDAQVEGTIPTDPVEGDVTFSGTLDEDLEVQATIEGLAILGTDDMVIEVTFDGWFVASP